MIAVLTGWAWLVGRQERQLKVPADHLMITTVERGEFLEFMRDILDSQACRDRGLYERAYVDKLLARPDAPEHFTKLNGSKLWHMALLELWLQSNVDKA